MSLVEAKIHNPEMPSRYREVSLLADTGAMYSIIPRQILKDLGIKPWGKRKFKLANGQVIAREVGGALYRYKEYIGNAPVIFGKENDNLIMGVTALEAMGLEVDPITKEIKPTELLLL